MQAFTVNRFTVKEGVAGEWLTDNVSTHYHFLAGRASESRKYRGAPD